MSKLIPYAVHYLHNGKPTHFFATVTTLCEDDAIRMAARHAGNGQDNWIPLGLPRESMLKAADKLGVTKVRWNMAG